MTHSVAVDGAPDLAGQAVTSMIGRTIERPGFLLVACALIGFLIQVLIYGSPPGVGYTLAAVAIVAGWLLIGRSLQLRIRPSALFLALLLVLAGLTVAWRASPSLQALNVLAGLGLVLLIASVYLPGGLARFSLTDYLAAEVLASFASLVHPFLLFFDDWPHARRAPVKTPVAAQAPLQPVRRDLMPAVRGILLALPLVLVFGALFYAADAVFAGYVRQLFNWNFDLADVFSRLVITAILAWLALGLARYAFTRDPNGQAFLDVERPAGLQLGHTETTIVLALLNALFVGFVAIQAVYLFGGADTLIRTGLTHSEYARRGFFELVTVAALVLSLVLLADWLARPRRAPGRPVGGELVLNLLQGLLVLLTLAILASALQRMQLYVREYGLTELRLYTTAFMGWLAVVLIWSVVTVLGQSPTGRRRFAFGALLVGLTLLLALNALNPDAFIARTNLARALGGTGRPLDVAYLGTGLSADAVPVLLAGLPDLRDGERQRGLACELTAASARLGQTTGTAGWRGANWSRARAVTLLSQSKAMLDRYATNCPAQQSPGP